MVGRLEEEIEDEGEKEKINFKNINFSSSITKIAFNLHLIKLLVSTTEISINKTTWTHILFNNF